MHYTNSVCSYSTALMINTDDVLISNQDVHVICTILTVYVGLSVLIEFPIPVTLISMVKMASILTERV